MPNEQLLEQVDLLRERFIRQQKTASNSQTPLKTMNDTQNRVQKTLSDYSDQNADADVNNSQAALANARLKEDVVDPLLPGLRRELKSLALISAVSILC
ncbi:MAG: hypothetical protein H7Y11_06760 [Armatimonadetes bacterium]|nr:hypothetical protein [Anaerolineae bacterium]